MIRHRFLAAVLGSLALLLAACGGSAQPAAPADSGGTQTEASAQEIVVTVDNQLTFNPATIELTAGQPVRLVLKNTGALEHDLTIDEIDVAAAEDGHAAGEAAHGASEAALHVHTNPGETSEITFTPQKSGTYTFYCSVPGHEEGGMQGTMNVK